MGPLLFTIFINDLPKGVKNICKLYADDTKLIATVKDISDCLDIQEDINIVQEWAQKWQSTFNCKKCKVMHFGKFWTCY